MIRNVHERVVRMSPARMWDLVAAMASPENVLWPSDNWPALVMDRPLGVGACGGHGPIRYRCSEFVPGSRVTFAFSPLSGFNGTHSFVVLPGASAGTCVLRHELVGCPGVVMAVQWGVVIRGLHDALLEELLDRAEAAAGEPPAHPATVSPWVRMSRWALVQASKVAAPAR